MLLQNKYINNREMQVLDVTELMDIEFSELQSQYSNFPCVMIDLKNLKYLYLFSNIKTLIITGGIATQEGLEVLYRQESIEILVLDFEETDSDLKGIDLTRFPSLKYVLSRSNLNIYKYDTLKLNNVHIQVLNFYRNGKIVRAEYPSNYDLYRLKHFLFFSTEAHAPAAMALINILKSAEERFWQQYHKTVFSTQIDEIGIIPICVTKEAIDAGFGRERRLVSLKRRAADIRLQISYDEFIHANSAKQLQMCKNNIFEAAQYIAKRDKTFKLRMFIDAINAVL